MLQYTITTECYIGYAFRPISTTLTVGGDEDSLALKSQVSLRLFEPKWLDSKFQNCSQVVWSGWPF